MGISDLKTADNTSAAESDWTCLWAAHQQDVYSFIAAAVGRWAEADDVLQETALAAWESFKEFEAGTNFRGWIFTIARHRILQHRRRQARQHVISQAVLDQIAAVAEEESTEQERLLKDCLRQLSERDRMLIQTYYELGGKVSLAASSLRRSARSVSQSLHRIRLRLYECIQRKMSRETRS